MIVTAELPLSDNQYTDQAPTVLIRRWGEGGLLNSKKKGAAGEWRDT